MSHIFKQYPDLDINAKVDPSQCWDQRNTQNLFKCYNNLEMEMVKTTVQWMRQYLNDKTLNELSWSHTFFLNCCEDTSGSANLFSLVAAKKDRISDIDESQMGGPVVLLIILLNLTILSEEARKTLVKKIKSIKISDLPGEHVPCLTNQLAYVIKWLKHDKLPDDLSADLLVMLQTTSNKNFNSNFELLKTLVHMKTNNVPLWEDLFQMANDLYYQEVRKLG